MQYTSKMKLRNVPILQRYALNNTTPPTYMALGFAAYILFMKSSLNESGKYVGELNGKTYTITDDLASKLHQHWLAGSVEEVVLSILKDTTLWDIDLSSIAGFSDKVASFLQSLIDNGFEATVNSI